MVIIWPLLGKLVQPVGMQQRPRWTGNLLKPTMPARLPWDMGGPGLTNWSMESFRLTAALPQIFPWPNIVHELKPYPPTYFLITGTTKDANGVALGNCVVHLMNTADDRLLRQTTSDANGLFEFREGGQPPNAYYLVAYLAGSPDVAGTTVNTLTGI